MNRRNIIKATIAGGLVAPVSMLASPDVKREAIQTLLCLSDREAMAMTLLRVAMDEGHYCRSYALELLESGIPIEEVQARVTDRINYVLFGDDGPPVYENGCRVAGGSMGSSEQMLERIAEFQA